MLDQDRRCAAFHTRAQLELDTIQQNCTEILRYSNQIHAINQNFTASETNIKKI